MCQVEKHTTNYIMRFKYAVQNGTIVGLTFVRLKKDTHHN